MKTLRQLIFLLPFGLFAQTTNATLIDLATTGFAAGQEAERLLACEVLSLDTSACATLVFDYKFDSFPLSPVTQNAEGVHGDYQAANYVEGEKIKEQGVTIDTIEATVDLGWLMDDGWGLFAIGVKQSQNTRWYGLDDLMRADSEGFMTITTVVGETGISHVSLFSAPFTNGSGGGGGGGGTPIPEPGTLGLLGLGLLGLGLRRRNNA